MSSCGDQASLLWKTTASLLPSFPIVHNNSFGLSAFSLKPWTSSSVPTHSWCPCFVLHQIHPSVCSCMAVLCFCLRDQQASTPSQDLSFYLSSESHPIPLSQELPSFTFPLSPVATIFSLYSIILTCTPIWSRTSYLIKNVFFEGCLRGSVKHLPLVPRVLGWSPALGSLLSSLGILLLPLPLPLPPLSPSSFGDLLKCVLYVGPRRNFYKT